MAAYAALRSVMHIVDQLQHHPFPPISIEKKQVESLTKNVTFLLDFLEGYKPTGKYEGDGVESRILDAANAAEDVIESHIVDRIRGRSTSHADEVEFSQRLQKVIEDMDLIKNETMATKEKMGAVKQQLQANSTSSSGGQKLNTIMVGFDDVKLELLDKLTGGGLNRQIIPIVGMGGMGKTTLARNVYEHGLIRQHFDILAWTTISQEYDARKILTEIVSQAMGNSNNGEEKQVGEDLYKYLFGRRYLIVMDDMWSIEAWDKIKFFFPENENGSRIVVTTRLSDLARRLSNSYSLQMSFLDMDESWDLFSKIVFTREDYPPELVEIGRKIVENCRGLPLSIVVVGGFLAKSEYKREHWENIMENLNSIVNSDNDEYGLKILQLSYNQLPVHLKPCFLYMGVFKEDKNIIISMLVKLWAAEGFLKPISGKDLEEVAEEYLYDLIDRNLILTANDRGRRVKIHDLLRDLCMRQAKAERFYSIVTQRGIIFPHNNRRLIFSEAKSKEEIHDVTMSCARSVISFARGISPSPHHSLLRIFVAYKEEDLILSDNCFHENKLQLVNFRCLLSNWLHWDPKFATSLHLLWSLQTLIISCGCDSSFIAPAEIWNMRQLRHVQVEWHMHIPDPPICSGEGDIVLEYLYTLKVVKNFKCSEEMIKRIPNIKKLGLLYEEDDEVEESCLNNLDRLHKLKSLHCRFYLDETTGLLHKLSFPRSLRKLVVIGGSYVYWEDMMEKIGSLPLLEKLRFSGGYFRTHVWETVEGKFLNLRFLEISSCRNLENWYSEYTHFPRLEHLVLANLSNLNAITEGIGEIPTLQSIEMLNCSESSIFSCKRMQVEQEELYGEDEVTFKVEVRNYKEVYDKVQHLKSTNFKVNQW